MPSPSACSLLIPHQVLTGEQPFRNIKSMELAYHVSFGVRPDLPANAEAIGISDSLWKLIRKCWDGENRRRPRVQEVVVGVAKAAANWYADMPPSATEQWEDSVTEEGSDGPRHGEPSLSSTVLFFPYAFRAVGMFQSYQSENASLVDPYIDTSRSGSDRAGSIRPTEVETYEERVFKHLEQSHPPPPTAIPPRKRKWFRYRLKKIFGRNSGH